MPKFREGHCIFPHKRNLYKHAYRDTPTPPPKLCSNLPPIWFLLDRNALRFSLHLSETVFLGVIMDENLNWTSEISHVANQVINVQELFVSPVSICLRKPYEHYIFLSSLSILFLLQLSLGLHLQN